MPYKRQGSNEKGKKYESQINLIGAHVNDLADSMVAGGSKLTGGADPRYGHNPLTNPVAHANQNPYIQKIHK